METKRTEEINERRNSECTTRDDSVPWHSTVAPQKEKKKNGKKCSVDDAVAQKTVAGRIFEGNTVAVKSTPTV